MLCIMLVWHRFYYFENFLILLNKIVRLSSLDHDDVYLVLDFFFLHGRLY